MIIEDFAEYINSRRNQEQSFIGWTRHNEQMFFEEFTKLYSQLDSIRNLLGLKESENIEEKISNLLKGTP